MSDEFAKVGMNVNSVLTRLLDRYRGYVEVGNIEDASTVLEAIVLCADEASTRILDLLPTDALTALQDQMTLATDAYFDRVIGMNFEDEMNVIAS